MPRSRAWAKAASQSRAASPRPRLLPGTYVCAISITAAGGGGARLGGGEEAVLEVGLAVGRLEPPRVLPPQHDLLLRRRLPTAGLRQRRRPWCVRPQIRLQSHWNVALPPFFPFLLFLILLIKLPVCCHGKTKIMLKIFSEYS